MRYESKATALGWGLPPVEHEPACYLNASRVQIAAASCLPLDEAPDGHLMGGSTLIFTFEWQHIYESNQAPDTLHQDMAGEVDVCCDTESRDAFPNLQRQHRRC